MDHQPALAYPAIVAPPLGDPVAFSCASLWTNASRGVSARTRLASESVLGTRHSHRSSPKEARFRGPVQRRVGHEQSVELQPPPEVLDEFAEECRVGLVALGHPQKERDATISRAHQVHHELLEIGPPLARVAVGYAYPFGLPLLLSVL